MGEEEVVEVEEGTTVGWRRRRRRIAATTTTAAHPESWLGQTKLVDSSHVLVDDRNVVSEVASQRTDVLSQ